MKKKCLFLVTAFLLLGLMGCSSGEPDPNPENFTFTYNETEIALNAEAAPIIAALGGPKSYTEEPSCAFDGMDKTYYYGGFYLSTYPLNGKDYVYSIWFVDDSVATEDGIRIGSTQAQVESLYGADCFRDDNACTQVRGDSRLTILLTDGVVSSIQYQIEF